MLVILRCKILKRAFYEAIEFICLSLRFMLCCFDSDSMNLINSTKGRLEEKAVFDWEGKPDTHWSMIRLIRRLQAFHPHLVPRQYWVAVLSRIQVVSRDDNFLSLVMTVLEE